jgi:hypothetical protein
MNGTRNFVPWIVVMAVLAVTHGSGSAHAADPTSPASPENPSFRKTDTNRDGYVSQEEAKRLSNFERAFSEADDNRDGKLDADEFLKAQAIHDRIRVERVLDDSVITAKVKAALLKDLRLKGLEVSVETYQGTVLLSGFVKDAEQARRAAEVAASIGGVGSVRNSLVVKG